MNDQDPFERQVADVAQRTVGPERPIDAMAIARTAAAPRTRSGFTPSFSGFSFVAGALVVVVLGVLAVGTGLLDGDAQPQQPGAAAASPLASAESASPGEPASTATQAPEATAAPALPGMGPVPLDPTELTFATGTLRTAYSGVAWEEIEGSDALLVGPVWYDVESSDARLSGEGVQLVVTADFDEMEVDDPDADPAQDLLSVYYGRLEIANAQGSWSGTIGPHLLAVDAAKFVGETSKAREKAGRKGSFDSIGATVLHGAGAYEGFTAYLYFPFEGLDDLDQRGDPDVDGEAAGSPFKAVIVNRSIPGFPTEAQWSEQVR
jgi:hypothetical protein